MKKIFCFLFLHTKKQWTMYLLPLIFVYVVLIQYQRQVLAVADANTMVKVYDISQKYGCLFFVWYQYLSWRYVLSVRQREVVIFQSFKKRSWFILNLFLTYLLLSGYLIWLLKATGSINNVLMISVQFLFSSVEVSLLINLIKSPLSGLMMYLIYIVLCMSECIPGDWCIINLGIMPDSYSISWLLKHLLFSIMLTGSIKIKAYL